MAKIDNFMEDKYVPSKEDNTDPIAIVLGRTELANQVIEILSQNRIRVLHLSEPFLMVQEQRFVYLLALSDNDADNIVLYKIGFKLYGIDNMICLCNDIRNESMFVKENIPYLSRKQATAQGLYESAIMRKEKKV